MNTHDPAFRRAFRRGVKFYGSNGVFAIIRHKSDWLPVAWIVPEAFVGYEKVIYWNPDGKRWRRFDPSKIKLQEATHEKRKGL